MPGDPMRDNPVFSCAAGLRRAMSVIQWALILTGAAFLAAGGIMAPAISSIGVFPEAEARTMRLVGFLTLASGLVFGIAWRRAFRVVFRRKFGGPPPPP
ncbi:MAG: hypothetical protein N3A38_08300 [Planctomycetota bacterium]|nr:hypothetical protein [Planctomycetota bacterium]